MAAPTFQINFRTSPELHAALMAKAVESGATQTQIVNDALRKHLGLKAAK